MECREVRQLAEAFVSEQLLVETTRAVVAHLEQCPSCRAEIEDLRRLRSATRTAFARAPEVAARPEFTTELRARLQTGASATKTSVMPRRRWLAIAASGVLVAGLGWGWREWSVSRLSGLLYAAIGDHKYCALTFKLAERPIDLKEAARRYGGAYTALETLEPSATELSGGLLKIVERHSCVYEGRRFAHIVLLYKDEKVSLLLTGDPRADGDVARVSPAMLPATDGFTVATFSGTHHAVFVVSSLNEEDAAEVTRALIGPISRVLNA